jgi:hypothetical protein
MKYKIINNKGYNISYGRFELLPGTNEVTCSEYEAKVLSSSNGLLVEKVEKVEKIEKVEKTEKTEIKNKGETGKDINLLKT